MHFAFLDRYPVNDVPKDISLLVSRPLRKLAAEQSENFKHVLKVNHALGSSLVLVFKLGHRSCHLVALGLHFCNLSVNARQTQPLGAFRQTHHEILDQSLQISPLLFFDRDHSAQFQLASASFLVRVFRQLGQQLSITRQFQQPPDRGLFQANRRNTLQRAALLMGIIDRAELSVVTVVVILACAARRRLSYEHVAANTAMNQPGQPVDMLVGLSESGIAEHRLLGAPEDLFIEDCRPMGIDHLVTVDLAQLLGVHSAIHLIDLALSKQSEIGQKAIDSRIRPRHPTGLPALPSYERLGSRARCIEIDTQLGEAPQLQEFFEEMPHDRGFFLIHHEMAAFQGIGIEAQDALTAIRKPSLGACPRTILDSSDDVLAFKLRKANTLNHHHLPDWSGRIKAFFQTEKGCAVPLQKLPELTKILNVAAEP